MLLEKIWDKYRNNNIYIRGKSYKINILFFKIMLFYWWIRIKKMKISMKEDKYIDGVNVNNDKIRIFIF